MLLFDWVSFIFTINKGNSHNLHNSHTNTGSIRLTGFTVISNCHLNTKQYTNNQLIAATIIWKTNSNVLTVCDNVFCWALRMHYWNVLWLHTSTNVIGHMVALWYARFILVVSLGKLSDIWQTDIVIWTAILTLQNPIKVLCVYNTSIRNYQNTAYDNDYLLG